MQISNDPPAPILPLRPWTVLGHIDATSPDLEPYEMKRIADLDIVDKPNTNVVLEVRHKPVNRTMKAIKAGLAASLAPVAAIGGAVAGVALFATGFGAIPAVGAAALGLVEGALLASTSKAGQSQLRRLKWEPQNPNTDWQGTRTLELNSAKGVAPTVLSQTDSTHAPDGKTLGESLGAKMKAYPAERYAVILGGHGRAMDSVGHISVKDMAEATRIAHQESGSKIDALMLDSCLVGNFETLLPMADHVRFGVVSEEPLYTGVFDWTSIVNALQDRTPSPQDFGNLAVHYSEFSHSPRTVSVVDMGALPALKGALETLAHVVDVALDSGHRAPIARAFKQAAKIKDSGTLERKMENKLDLGSLLKELAAVPVPSVQKAAQEAIQSYQGAVPAHSASEHYPESTGLSIQGPLPWHSVSGYAKETGMEHWSEMLGNMRPLPLRLLHTVAEKAKSLLGQG